MAIFLDIERMKEAGFEWDTKKNQLNIEKHGVDFYDAQQAFLDKNVSLQKILIIAMVRNVIFVLEKYQVE